MSEPFNLDDLKAAYEKAKETPLERTIVLSEKVFFNWMIYIQNLEIENKKLKQAMGAE